MELLALLRLVADGGITFATVAAIISLVITIAGVTYSIATRPRGKDRSKPGQGFVLRENLYDPNRPIPRIYGKPSWTPPILYRYKRSAALNGLWPTEDQTLVVGLSLGSGPIDGRGLTLWMNDALLHDHVDADSPLSFRQLVAVDATRKRFVFPKTDVVKTSVLILLDGVAQRTYGGIGGSIFENTEETRTNDWATPRLVFHSGSAALGVFKDSHIDWRNGPRVGGFFPAEGVVPWSSVKVEIVFKKKRKVTSPGYAKGWGNSSWFGNGVKSVILRPEHLHRGKVDGGDGSHAGDVYFWTSLKIHGGTGTRSLVGPADIQGFRVSYRVRKEIHVEQDVDGTTHAIFQDSQGAAVAVTAHYDTSVLGDSLRTHLRLGEVDQEPLPLLDGVRNAYVVSDELTEGTPRTYTTTNKVHDALVELQSDAGGFFGITLAGKDGGRTWHVSRQVVISMREENAPDAIGKNADPTTGWIRLVDPVRNADTFLIQGHHRNSAASWVFSLADLLANTQGKDPGREHALPFAKYHVKVVALDTPNVRADIFSKLFFADVTEVIRNRLALPRHATLTIEIDREHELASEPVFTVGIAGARVWVPDSDAVFDLTTERPEPGEMVWTRNPVWCALDLVLDPDFGGGQFYTWESNVNLPQAIASAAFCDELVLPRQGAGETRSELDAVITDRGALLHHVGQLLAGSQVIPTLDGGTWGFIPDDDATDWDDPDEVFSIVEATDIAGGEISMRDASLEEIPTTLEISFTNEETNFELDVEVVRLQGTEPSQEIRRSVDFTGVRRRSQVVRFGSILLQQFTRHTRSWEITGAHQKFLRYESGNLGTLTAPDSFPGLVAQKVRLMLLASGSNSKAALLVTEHDPQTYAREFIGPNSGVAPGTRPPPTTDGMLADNEKKEGTSSTGGVVTPTLVDSFRVLKRRGT